MLVDPSGNRLQSSVSIEIVDGKVQDGTGQFNYLVEVCDPCEANNYGYAIQGVIVSDFLTPHYYDPIVTPGTRYSFTGSITAPRQMLPGGYISYIDQVTNQWQQILWVDPGSPPIVKKLGPAAGKSLREWVDNELSKEHSHQQHDAIHSFSAEYLKRQRSRRDALDQVALARGRMYGGGK